jgi:hypothetical protein
MKILGILKPPSFIFIKGLIHNRGFYTTPQKMSIGEVYTDEIVKDNSPVLSNFFQLLADNGYAKRESRRYHSLSLTSCKGSVDPHDDPGLGLMALWLVHRKPLHKNQQGWSGAPQVLYGSKQWLYLKLGTIVVFDSNKEHAWLSNYYCSMIMQSVKKTCKKFTNG